MKYNYKEIGERLVKERKRLGLSQDELLDRIRDKGNPTCGRNTLSGLENGKEKAFCAIKPGQLMALCEEFNCTVSYLFGEYEQRNYDDKFICERTGLWSENVSKLKEDSPDGTPLLVNALLSYKNINDLSRRFSFMLCDMIRDSRVLKKIEDCPEETTLSSDEYQALSRESKDLEGSIAVADRFIERALQDFSNEIYTSTAPCMEKLYKEINGK